jgi:hypothetical protein
MNLHNRREKRWGERNMGGLIWGLIFGLVIWAVIIAAGVLIYRAAK